MARTQPYLSPRAKEALISYIALNGENYEKYVAYATNQGWKLFSRRYIHTWVGRHRDDIQLERTLCVQKLRSVSVMDKQRRLNEMEVNSQQLQLRIQNAHSSDMPSEELIKLMDMHRKLCQAIAVERGEWGVKDDGSTELQDVTKTLLERMSRQMKKLPEGFVEGEAREI